MPLLADRLSSRSFTADSHNGFLLEKIRPESITGRFIEKILVKQFIENPLGGELIYDRIEFKQTKFIASASTLGIELIDAPRGLNTFTSRLSEMCDHKLTISEPRVDVLAWAENFENELGQKILIPSAQLNQIEIEEGVTGAAVLRGARDIRPEISSLFPKRRHVVEKIKISFLDARKASLTIAHNGAAKFDNADERGVVALRNALNLTLR
jgi:hypothetical protein